MPFSAGGTTDLFGRLLAQHMQKNFDKPFIVENRAGAGGNIGAGMVAKAAPDGYTFLVGTVSTHAINPFLYSKLPYDTVKDFQPVSLIARLPNILVVHPSLPAKNVQELIALPEGQPGQAVLRLVRRRHLDPSRRRAVQDQDRHHDDPCAVPLLRRHHEQPDRRPHQSRLRQRRRSPGRRCRPDGCARSPSRRSPAQPFAPDVPPVADTIPGFEATSWHGVFAPAGTPKPIVDKMAAEMKRILELPDVKEKLSEIGAVASPMTPEDFVKFIDGERTKWAEVVKASGAKMD